MNKNWTNCVDDISEDYYGKGRSEWFCDVGDTNNEEMWEEVS